MFKPVKPVRYFRMPEQHRRPHDNSFSQRYPQQALVILAALLAECVGQVKADDDSHHLDWRVVGKIMAILVGSIITAYLMFVCCNLAEPTVRRQFNKFNREGLFGRGAYRDIPTPVTMEAGTDLNNAGQPTTSTVTSGTGTEGGPGTYQNPGL